MHVRTPWWVLFSCLLVAKTTAAQPQPSARSRQDRRASLAAAPAEPIPELYVAAGNLTTVAFNGSLDRDSLVVDRTRFKWVDVGDRILALQPFADLGPGERLFVKIGFKDRALPAQAVLAVVTDSKVMDGNVEVDRRANTPEALLAALTQKEAELEELKARSAGSGPMGLALSGWLSESMAVVRLLKGPVAGDRGLEVTRGTGYQSAFSTLVVLHLRNLPGQTPWALGQVRLIGPQREPVKVLLVQLKPAQLAPGETGLVVVEAATPPWAGGKTFSMELAGASGHRRLSIHLMTQ
ncbi:DUF2381 family protein [Hyalangium sp.]|uniref:DUF2381 family protein n=1 Tax=Hyalangium sp. TaxID=2028555 RepID=UPI002D6B52B4|nr:DUF2381 family protein [Hyalangium sp.]HYH94488.1 DUF2381 family protein [Hyalangium sp.]